MNRVLGIMDKPSKGEATRQNIVEETRKLFNKEGFAMTLSELASKLNISTGKITNHFPTKDHLYVALSKAYHEEFSALQSSFSWEAGFSINRLNDLIGLIMDLQHKYRCLMLIACSTGLNQRVMLKQVTASWRNDKEGARVLVSSLVGAGLLDKSIETEYNFASFQFQFINLFTTWLVSFTLYDRDKKYSLMKPVYQRGLLMCLYPYLTAKGRKQLQSVFKT